MKWLRNPTKLGGLNITMYEKDPALNNLRNDSRFVELMKEVKSRWEENNKRYTF